MPQEHSREESHCSRWGICAKQKLPAVAGLQALVGASAAGEKAGKLCTGAPFLTACRPAVYYFS